MLARLLIAALFLGVAFAAYAAWKRPPRRLSRLDLAELGVRGPAIVQFSMQNCAPCRAAVPHLTAAADAANVGYEHVDLDERPDLAQRYGIRTVPTIVVAAGSGEILGKWTRLPQNGEVSEAAEKARAAT